MSNEFSNLFGQPIPVAEIPKAADYDVLPPGKYPGLVEKAELKTTQKGDGQYVSLEFLIIDGMAKGRKLWSNINIANPNAKCVQIGLGELASLGTALGFTHLTGTDQLLNGVCLLHVKVDKNGDNVIRTYSAINSPMPQTSGIASPPVQPAPLFSQQTQSASPVPSSDLPPWMKTA